MIETTTAIRAPGIFLLTMPSPMIVTRTKAETTVVGTLPSDGMSLTLSTNFSMVPPDWPGTPNMAPNWPIATWMPTPVRNPMRTLRERKFAMKPSLRRRAPIEDDAAHQGRERRELDVLRGLGRGAHRQQSGRHDGRGRRVGPHDEVSRRTEDRERDDRQDDRVETRDHRHAGDLGVAHDLGDRERRERRACDHIDADPRRVDGQDAREDRKRLLATLRMGRRHSRFLLRARPRTRSRAPHAEAIAPS